MSSPLHNSMFHFLLSKKDESKCVPVAIMGGLSGSRFYGSEFLSDVPIVFFDFETTGLDLKTSRIIEIGAIKYLNRKEIGRFSTLVNPNVFVSDEIVKITGIDNSMLKDMPFSQDVLPSFHDFIRGCVGIAHNAEYDVGILFHESNRLGISCDYTVFCTLKMARSLIQIEKRNLDSLAAYYGLSFEARHRSIGDSLVTAEIFWHMLDENLRLKSISDLLPYKEAMPE